MATMKEHLAKLHKRHAVHYTETAQNHKAMAGHFEQLASHFKKTAVTEAEKDAQGTLAALADENHKIAREHSTLASWHQGAQEECEKATDAADLDKLMPTRVSAIAPDRSSIRPVLRHGMQPFAVNTAADITKIIGNDEESMHSEEPSLQ